MGIPMIHHLQHVLNTAVRWFWKWISRDDANEYARPRRGRKAEKTVAHRFRRAGYRILDCNFECKNGEIDIIAFHDGKVVFVEVRSVTDPAFVDPLASIPPKQRRIIRAAQRYATINNLRNENVILRLDAVGIHYDQSGDIKDIEHIVDAFRG